MKARGMTMSMMMMENKMVEDDISFGHLQHTRQKLESHSMEERNILLVNPFIMFRFELIIQLSVPSCKNPKGAISSYRLTFCTSRKCLIPSHARAICTHNPSKEGGYTPTKAVILDDLDEWSWDVNRLTAWQTMRAEAVGKAYSFFLRTWVLLITAIQ
jgi:hypothetical protein